MSHPIFVAFATQKGGVGKSTITALAANYIHNVLGYSVAVVDCDYPQQSIAGLRDKELALIDSSPYFKTLACDHFRKSGRRSFTVFRSTAASALDDAEAMLSEEEEQPDFVFFDMPGTLNSDGVVKTLSQMDYIFTPVSADRFVVESALQFIQLFNDNLVTKGLSRTKGIYLFWTMVDGREKTCLYDVFGKMFTDLGIPVLSARLPDSKRFRREHSEERKTIFRSTIFPADPGLLRGSRIKELSEEICSILKQ